MTVAAAVPFPYLTSLASGLAAKDQLSPSCGPSIAVSYLLATGATLAALACGARIRLTPRGRSSRGVRSASWTGAAAVAVGAAVWSTQLAGTVSCRYGGTALFDLRLILMSGLVVPLGTGAGLAIVATNPASSRRLVVGGALSGAGWSAASFMTIAALRTTGTLRYDFLLAALSVVMNVATATVLCWVAFRPGERYRRALVAAMLLGAAIRGGYYTALSATRTIPDTGNGWSTGLDPFALGLVTAAGSTIVLMFIAVAAAGGLLQPRVVGFGTTSRPWVPRRGGTAGRLPTPSFGFGLRLENAHAATPGDANPPMAAGSESPESRLPAAPTSPGGVPAGVPAARAPDLAAPRRPVATPTMLVTPAVLAGLLDAVTPPPPPAREPAASPALAELTSEELAYVGRSFAGTGYDAVELLESADEPSDPPLAPSKAAIDDVPTVDPGDNALFDLEPAATMATAAGGPDQDPVGLWSGADDPDPGEWVSVLVPVPRAPRAGSPAAGEPTASPAPPPGPGTGPAARPAALSPSSPVWTAALPAGVPAGPPTGLTTPPGTTRSGAPATEPTPLWSVGVDPLGVSGITADTPRRDGVDPPAGRPWAESQFGGVGPQPRWAVPLWFPPPAWWFLTPTLGRRTATRYRADDPSAPTRPLRLAPARPPH